MTNRLLLSLVLLFSLSAARADEPKKNPDHEKGAKKEEGPAPKVAREVAVDDKLQVAVRVAALKDAANQEELLTGETILEEWRKLGKTPNDPFKEPIYAPSCKVLVEGMKKKYPTAEAGQLDELFQLDPFCRGVRTSMHKRMMEELRKMEKEVTFADLIKMNQSTVGRPKDRERLNWLFLNFFEVPTLERLAKEGATAGAKRLAALPKDADREAKLLAGLYTVITNQADQRGRLEKSLKALNWDAK